MVDTDGLSGGPDDASVPETSTDAGVDVIVDAPADACAPFTLDGALTTDLGGFVPGNEIANLGYPKIDSLDGRSTTILSSNAAGTYTSIKTQLYWAFPISLASFRASFDVYVTCTFGAQGFCADALAFVWVEAKEIPSIADGKIGGGANTPVGVKGGAVFFDLYQNQELGDPQTPGIELVDFDSRKAGDEAYDWTRDGVSFVFTDQTQHVEIVQSKGDVTVKVGSKTLSGSVDSIASGYFGFTSIINGGSKTVYAVRNFDISASSCP